MDQFVCVRIVQANAMDLSLFQFDYDLTLAAFFMNADKTIYGRFGTRSDTKDATRDISIEGLRRALQAALKWHKGYPTNKSLFRDKRRAESEYKTPDEYPSLRGKFKAILNYDKNVTQSCMHCHQIHDARQELYRSKRKPLPDHIIYPWPMPSVIGLSLDPREIASVRKVTSNSIADRVGFRRGDQIELLNGQPILSIADVQWVLHNARDGDQIKVQVVNDGQERNLVVPLKAGWRSNDEISWRTTSWNLRRIAAGGLLLGQLPEAARRKAGIANARMALIANHVGQYGAHAVAKRAGFRKGDVIVAFDGRTDLMTETQLFEHVLKSRMPSAMVDVTVLRGNRRIKMRLRMQ